MEKFIWTFCIFPKSEFRLWKNEERKIRDMNSGLYQKRKEGAEEEEEEKGRVDGGEKDEIIRVGG